MTEAAYRLEFRQRALDELGAIRDYLLEHAGDQAAERVRLHLLQRFETLRRRPAIGLATNCNGIRILTPTQYPYRIYYLVLEDCVVILHVRHTSREPIDVADL